MELIATCSFGLEKLVYNEIKKLGLWVHYKDDGRVVFEGTLEEMAKANIWLRCAERVQIKLAEFKAETFDELFDQVNVLDWPKILPENAEFPVLCSTTRSKLHNEPAIQSIVKKSIVKNLQAKYNIEQIPETGPLYKILARFKNDICTISLDSTGDSLHKRGYRTESTEASIKETLAAALVLLSDWTPEKTLIDPFCGSGTILIEAGMIGHNIAPGLNRSFTFETWPECESIDLEKIKKEAAAEQNDKQIHLNGYDRSPLTIKIAQANSTRANLQKSIHLTVNDFRDLDFGRMANCVIVTNPPYGERMASTEEAEQNYKDLGEKFLQTLDSSLYIITPDTNFQELFGKPAHKNRKLFNGKIKCYLYQYPQGHDSPQEKSSSESE